MEPARHSLVWVLLLNQLTDGWRHQGITDVSILVARLLFCNDTVHQGEVLLSALLGGIDVGDLEMSLCVPLYSLLSGKSTRTVSSGNQLSFRRWSAT